MDIMAFMIDASI